MWVHMTVVARQTKRMVRVRERSLTFPEIDLIAVTRVALGVGLGLLLADRLSRDARKVAGLALVAVGALTTIPIVVDLFGKPQLTQAP